MSLIIRKFEDKDVNLIPIDNNQRFCIDFKETAKIIDVSEKTIFRHMTNHSDEFLEGEDFARVQYLNSRNERRFKRALYPEGFILMTMFVRSKKAAQARKWIKKVMAELVQRKATLVTSQQIDELQTVINTLREDLSSARQKLQLLETGYEKNLQKLTGQELGKICKMVDHIVRLQHKIHRRPLSKLYPEVWTALHKKYGVHHYRDLERCHLISVIMYLDGQLSVCYLQEKQMQAG